MKIEEYRVRLRSKGQPDSIIDKQLAIIGDFADFLANPNIDDAIATAGKEEVESYARKLISEGKNTYENFKAMRDYASWIDQRNLYVALVEVVECGNAIEVLSNEMKERYGQDVRNRIFREEFPPLGASEKERCAYTQMITKRMTQNITPEESRNAWFQVQHGIPVNYWQMSDMADKEKYRQCGSIDEFLNLKWRERNDRLTRLRSEGSL